MIKALKIRILVDNKSDRAEYLSEHGFAVWIEAEKKKILFDTGNTGNVLVNNAAAQGIDLSTADYLVISHGHYDHTGGVSAILRCNPEIKIIAHPSISVPRYSRQKDQSIKSVGMTTETKSSLKNVLDRIQWAVSPYELFDGVGVTGQIARKVPFEDTGGSFFLEPECQKKDLIEDDLSMWFYTDKGIVVICGCCHSGVINTINQIKSLFKKKTHIHALVGGLHLCNSSEQRINKTIDYLKNEKIDYIIPAHCTGNEAFNILRKEFKSRFQVGSVGTQFFLF